MNMLGHIAEWWASYLFQLPIGEDERVYGMFLYKYTLGMDEDEY